MKYYFPIHLDGGNRGCEAIAKGTALLLKAKKEDLLGLCRDISMDTKLGIDDYVTLIRPIVSPLLSRIKNKVIRLFHLPYTQEMLDPGIVFLENMEDGDVLISTGGDMMCYGNNNVITTNNYVHSRGLKSILWGCSMGPENLTPEKEETLHNFSLIYARESLSYEFFRSLGLNNVCLFPDPAFILEPEKCVLPECFQKEEVVGINLSNYVLGDFSLNTSFGKEVVKMLDYIVNETELKVLLIPHVVWDFPGDRQNDKHIASIVMKRYGMTGRFSVMDIDNLNYCQIRYIISQCRMFVGSRTHAVISAYATCTPALALGYSIKSKGIAKDLGLPDKLVVDSKHICSDCLVDSFKFLETHEADVRQRLGMVIPAYIETTYGIRDVMGTI